MPSKERKMLEQLGKKGVTLPPGIPKGWSDYNGIKDCCERGRVKRVIRELHAQHCPPGSFQNNDGQSVSSRGRGGYRSSTTSQRYSAYGNY